MFIRASRSCSHKSLTFLQLKATIYSLVDQSESIIKGAKFPDKGITFTADGRWMALVERRDSKEYVGIYSTQDWKLVNVTKLTRTHNLAY